MSAPPTGTSSPVTSYRNPPSATSSRSTSPASSARTRTKSIESSSAHPLSSDDNESTSLDTSTSLLAPLEGSPDKPPIIKGSSYAVYKPRQRPISTGSSSSVSKANPAFSPSSQVAAATTSTSVTAANTVSIPASPGSPNSVTSKLQLQSLQATLQAAGLGHDSAGWHVVQKLVADHDKPKEAAGWDIIHMALKSGKACLLLPKEQESLSDITPRFLRDHIILREGASLVTLSGIRGVKQDDTITFASCVPGLDLKQAMSSDSALFELLGTSPPSVGHSDVPLSFVVGKQLELHIPRQHNVAAVPKIAKPTKPRTLASLFGGSRAGAPVSPNTSPNQRSKNPDQALGLAAEPLSETSVVAGAGSATMTIVAWPVEHILVAKKLSKAVHQSIEARTRAALEPEDGQVASMAVQFLHRFHPPYKLLRSASPIAEEDLEKEISTGSLVHAKIEDVTTAMQEFFYDIQLRLEQAEQERAALADAMTEDDFNEKHEQQQQPPSSSIDDSLERVEAFISDMLYDKIFSPASSSDRQEDESLSTRIAGLHMLDLTLDHLGFKIEAPNSSPDWDDEKRILQEGLEDIVVQCGKELEKLQHADCRTPLAKLEVLVQIHKIIADSLEQLPPIPMKDDSGNKDGLTTPGGRSGQVYEMSDDAKSLGGHSTRRAEGAEEDILLDRTPTMPSSRPSSVLDTSIPAIKLPDAAMKKTYPIQTPSAFIDDTPDPSTTSYFEVRSSTSSAAIGAVAPIKKASITSADAILPLLIYVVVRANPSKLVSHTLFVQRFRADSLMRGEGEYCLCNMEAVKSFLMSCDIGSLGLGTDKILTTPDIPIAPLRMRHRTAQQLDSMVGSAGKVLGLAGDIGLGGYRMLGGLLARNAPVLSQNQPRTLEEVQSVLAGSASKAASFKNSILRRSTVNSAVPDASTLQISPPAKETELADVSQDSVTSEQENQEKAAASTNASASISSRLASLPGLSRIGSQQATTTPAEQAEKAQSADILGNTAPPARTSLFAAFSLPLVPTQSSTSNASTSQNVSVAAEDSAVNARRSTISTFSPHSDAAAPLLSPRLNQTEAPSEISPPLTPGGSRERTTSFMSHSQHHDYLKTSRPTGTNSVTRNRSDSAASNVSNRRMAALSAVSNLVSNVRHGYTPSVSSVKSNSALAVAPPLQRFLDCEVEDLKIGEVALLLADYKRLAAALSERSGN